MKSLMLSLVKDFDTMRTWLNDARFSDDVFLLGDYTTKDGIQGIGFLTTCDISYFKATFLKALEKFGYDFSRLVFINQSSDATSCSYGRDNTFYKFNIIVLVDIVQHLSSTQLKRNGVEAIPVANIEAEDTEFTTALDDTQEQISGEPVVMTNEMFDALLRAVRCDEIPNNGFRGLGIGYNREVRSESDVISYVDDKLQYVCGVSLSRVKYKVESEGSLGVIVYFEDLPEIEYKPPFRITRELYLKLLDRLDYKHDSVECKGYKGVAIYNSDFKRSSERVIEIVNIALMQIAATTLDNVDYGVGDVGYATVVYFKDLPVK